MKPTKEVQKLDEAHSLLASLAEQGMCSAILSTVASVLSMVPALDNPRNNAHYWQEVILNLNILSDALSREELDDDAMFGYPDERDWDMSETILGDNLLEDDGA